jgi:hypothetical protein
MELGVRDRTRGLVASAVPDRGPCDTAEAPGRTPEGRDDRTGRSLGSDAFVDRLEAAPDRRLRLARRGPEPLGRAGEGGRSLAGGWHSGDGVRSNPYGI